MAASMRARAIMSTSEPVARVMQGIADGLCMKALLTACLGVVAKYRSEVIGSRLTTCEGITAVCFELVSCEPEMLADMNHDLAMEIAANERLLDAPVTAWFRCRTL